VAHAQCFVTLAIDRRASPAQSVLMETPKTSLSPRELSMLKAIGKQIKEERVAQDRRCDDIESQILNFVVALEHRLNVLEGKSNDG